MGERRRQWFRQMRASAPSANVPADWRMRAYEQIQPATGERRQLVGALGVEAISRTAESAAAAVSTNTRLQWAQIGPQPVAAPGGMRYSGRVVAIAPHPTNANIVYLSTGGGGVWKTTDGGTTWLPLTDQMPDLKGSKLALDPNDPQVLYWGTWDGIDLEKGSGLFKSTDGGTSWFYAGLANQGLITTILVDSADSRRVYVANWTGIYHSQDGGATWNRLFVAMWRSDPLQVQYRIAMHPTNSRVLYVAAPPAGIYRSLDRGATWQRLANGAPDFSAGYGNVFLATTPSSPDSIYLAHLGKLYKSHNRGDSWTSVNTPERASYGLFHIGPMSRDVIYFGGVHAWASTDGGLTWKQRVPTHVDYHSMAFGPDGWRYFGNDGGIWRTRDWHAADAAGPTPINLNRSLAITEFYTVGLDPQQPSTLYGGSQDQGAVYTTGSSLEWTEFREGDAVAILVSHADSNVVYSSAQNGMLYRCVKRSTFSCGSITTGISEPGAWVVPLLMHPTNAQTLFTATSYVYKSVNGGSRWSKISPRFETDPDTGGAVPIAGLTLDPQNPQILYALVGRYNARTGAGIYRTMDGGSTWMNLRSAVLPDRWATQLVVDPTISTTLYLTFSGLGGGHVFKSLNQGATWQDISGTLPDVPVNALVISPLRANQLVIGTDFGVFVTADGGSTWQRSDGLPNVEVKHLKLTSDNYLVAATYGRSMWRAPLVDLEAFVVKIVRPRMDAVLTGTLKAVGVRARDDVRTVRFFLDEEQSARVTDRNAPFKWKNWDTTRERNGSHRLAVIGYDARDHEIGRATVDFTIDNLGPPPPPPLP